MSLSMRGISKSKSNLINIYRCRCKLTIRSISRYFLTSIAIEPFTLLSRNFMQTVLTTCSFSFASIARCRRRSHHPALRLYAVDCTLLLTWLSSPHLVLGCHRRTACCSRFQSLAYSLLWLVRTRTRSVTCPSSGEVSIYTPAPRFSPHLPSSLVRLERVVPSNLMNASASPFDCRCSGVTFRCRIPFSSQISVNL